MRHPGCGVAAGEKPPKIANDHGEKGPKSVVGPARETRLRPFTRGPFVRMLFTGEALYKPCGGRPWSWGKNAGSSTTGCLQGGPCAGPQEMPPSLSNFPATSWWGRPGPRSPCMRPPSAGRSGPRSRPFRAIRGKRGSHQNSPEGRTKTKRLVGGLGRENRENGQATGGRAACSLPLAIHFRACQLGTTGLGV